MSVASLDPVEPDQPDQPGDQPRNAGWATPGVGPSWEDDDPGEAVQPLEPVVPDALADALSVVRALRTTARDAVTPAERAGWLLGLRQLADAAEVTFTDVLTRFDAAADGRALTGAASTTSWLSKGLRMSGGDGSTRVALARNSGVLAGPLDAAAGGALRFEHVRVINRALRPLATDQHERATDLLTELATVVPPSAVAVAARRIRDVAHPDGALSDREKQFSRRYLALSPLLDGMTAVDGLLDPEATATLYAALAPLMVPTGPDDTRTTDQRRADALTDVATLALRTGDLPVLSGTATTVDVLVDHATLDRLHRSATRTQHEHGARTDDVAATTSCSCAAGADASPTNAADWLRPEGAFVLTGAGDSLRLADHVLDRLACDSALGRIVFGPDSLPIDVGRRSRTFTPAQRRALTARDHGCRFPGCPRPPRYTDAHHLHHWEHGGATELANGLLLCRYHHNTTHHPTRPWTITADDPVLGTNGPLTFAGPDGQTLTSHPRGP